MNNKRTLLTAADVRKASGSITVNPRTIVTPSAQDLALSMGIKIVVSSDDVVPATAVPPASEMAGTSECACHIDHTNLSPSAPDSAITHLVEEGVQHGFAAVCVFPTRVVAARQARGAFPLRICSVVGFPSGAHDTALKVREVSDVVENGACEIDMVANNGWLADGELRRYAADILAVRRAVGDQNVLKVIIETSQLTPPDLVTAATIAAECGADFVKTSSGVYGHARIEDVVLLRRTLPSTVRIKAAGGIRTAKAVRNLLSVGADRIGTSSSVAILNEFREQLPA